MFCKNCGREIDDRAVVCPHCGIQQSDLTVYRGPDNGGYWWGLLGCCIPLAGLILFLVWKDTKPRTAKAAGTGALVAVVCIVLYYILVIALAAFASAMQ